LEEHAGAPHGRSSAEPDSPQAGPPAMCAAFHWTPRCTSGVGTSVAGMTGPDAAPTVQRFRRACHRLSREGYMNSKLSIVLLALGGLVGCASNPAPDVAGKIRDSLKQAGLNDVTVSQDRTKGVVTLGGNVAQSGDKARAEEIARPLADGQVVADEIAVLPKGNESADRSINSDLDKGIEANLDAAFKQANIKGIRHNTRNGVVTLKGELNTPDLRANAEKMAAGVPNVRQVVNEIDVKNQRATSSSADRSR
jgi:hyperosmotically inducible protein